MSSRYIADTPNLASDFDDIDRRLSILEQQTTTTTDPTSSATGSVGAVTTSATGTPAVAFGSGGPGAGGSTSGGTGTLGPGVVTYADLNADVGSNFDSRWLNVSGDTTTGPFAVQGGSLTVGNGGSPQATILNGTLNAAGNTTLGGSLTVATTLAVGNAATITGNLTVNGSSLNLTGLNASLDIGSVGTSNAPTLDFHSSIVSTNFDARIAVTGGTSADGAGLMVISAGGVTLPQVTNLNASGNIIVAAGGGSSFSGTIFNTAILTGGSYTSGNITYTTINSTNIVNGGALVTGSLSTGSLSINSGLTDSLILNGDFEDGTSFANWTQQYETTGAPANFWYSTANTFSGLNRAEVALATGQGTSMASSSVPVAAGQTLQITGQIRSEGANPTTGYWFVRAFFGTAKDFARTSLVAATPTHNTVAPSGVSGTNAAGYADLLGGVALANPAVWTRVDGTVVVPAGATWMRLAVYAWANASGGWIAATDGWSVRRQITTTQIGDGTITTPKVVANSITAEKLTISATGDNLLINGSMEDIGVGGVDGVSNVPVGWSSTDSTGSASTWYSETAVPIAGARGLTVFAPAGAGRYVSTSRGIPVSPGERYAVSSLMQRVPSGGSTTSAFYLRVHFMTPASGGTWVDASTGMVSATPAAPTKVTVKSVDGATIYSPTGTGSATGTADIVGSFADPAAGAPFLVSGQVVVPPGAAYMAVSVIAWTTASAWYAVFDDVRAEKALGNAALIVNGLITADGIGTGTLTAGTKITVGTAGAQRVEIDATSGGQGIRLYNASNATVVNLDANSGVGTFTGQINATSGSISGTLTVTGTLSGGVISGGSVLASTVRSTAAPGSANSWCLQNDYAYRVWNSSAVQSVLIDMNGNAIFNNLQANAGSFTGTVNAASGSFSGSITSTATITGGTITGATLQTGWSGQRVVITSGTADRVILYSGNGNEVNPGLLQVSDGGSYVYTTLASPRLTSGDYAYVQLRSSQYAGSDSYMTLHATNAAFNGAVSAASFSGYLYDNGYRVYSPVNPPPSSGGYGYGDSPYFSSANIGGTTIGSYSNLWANGGYMHVACGYGYVVQFRDTGDTVWAGVQGGAYSNMSSKHIKKNIASLSARHGLRALRNLRPVTYRLRAEHQDGWGDKDRLGLVAEEVEALLPHVVHRNGDGDPARNLPGIDYGAMTAVLIKAIQELDAKLELLDARLA